MNLRASEKILAAVLLCKTAYFNPWTPDVAKPSRAFVDDAVVHKRKKIRKRTGGIEAVGAGISAYKGPPSSGALDKDIWTNHPGLPKGDGRVLFPGRSAGYERA